MNEFRVNRAWLCCLFAAGIFLILGLVVNRNALAVDQIEIQNPVAIYTFGESVTFRGSISSDAGVMEATVFWQAKGDERTQQALAMIQNGEISYTQPLNRSPIRPFTTVEYWFGVRLASGAYALSETFTFEYTDNRYNWQARIARDFSIYWVEGDLSFAQQAFDIARAGVAGAQSYLPAPAGSPEGIRIYIYPSAAGLQSALQLAGFEWVAGHADPKLETILISIPPGPSQVREMERQLPHELMHLIIYRYLEAHGGSYRLIPVWLNEGLASNVEMYANPEYAMLLIDAYEKDDLFPIQSLCLSFPTGTREVIQAYAQSTAFVRYLHQQVGSSGLQELLLRYGDGLECERGAEAALGAGLSQLEQAWLENTFGPEQPTDPLPLMEFSPWALLLLLVLGIPSLVGLSMLRSHRSPANR
jgi:hypothetical protein